MADQIRVLVIDDDDVARELLMSTLERGGHEVYQLPSAIGATRMIAEHKIDVVVLDVMLPDISGDKLARLLRQHSRGAKLGIVLVSSRPLAELNGLAAAANADAVVQKGQIRAQLVTTVTSTFLRRKGTLS
jgi:two-component system phosphate regulon response regulator PhoB